MKLIRKLHTLSNTWEGCVVTIGNFDGVHKGHQQLIDQCLSLSKRYQVPSVVVTFEPYPKAFFSKDKTIPRLMSLRDKFLSLQKLGVDYLCILPFNARLAAMPAEDFIQNILVDRLKIKAVVIGDDFRFGANRQGDFQMMEAYGKWHNFEVLKTGTCLYDDERVSSSRLRTALSQGDMDMVEQLLGQPYLMTGRVVSGDRRGREFGFPTANIEVGQKKLPLSGIFVVTVSGIYDEALQGVASVGSRPMYPGGRDFLEVFLLDFDGDIYHQRCGVHFLKKLREEVCFDSEAELIDQMNKDVADAYQFFMEGFS